MSIGGRRVVGLLLLIALFSGVIVLLNHGRYGLGVFVVAPVFIGVIAGWVARPKTGKQAAGMGALAAFLAAFSLLAVGSEGVFCIIMVLPLALPLGALGGWLIYRAGSSEPATRGLTMLLLLAPASLVWDVSATPPVFAVRSSIEIAASPEQVWKHVVSFSELPEPTEWFFRYGVAYPQRARIVGSGAGAVRYCEFSTGPFVEPIEVWDEPRLLRFSVASNPAPMCELSPYAKILPRHLHGYLVSKHGEFRLTRLGNNRTLLEGTTWYQHGLWPAEYWRLWSDAIIHRIHMRVLTHIRTLAEEDGVTRR